MPPRSAQAFTLVEVLAALGLLAIAVLYTLSAQRAIERSLDETGETARAVQLVDATMAELMRLRDAPLPAGETSRLAALAGMIPGAQDAAALRWVGARDGTRVVREADAASSGSGIATNERFYLVEVRQQPSPLQFVREGGFLAITLRISWPYRAGVPTASRLSVTCHAALTP